MRKKDIEIGMKKTEREKKQTHTKEETMRDRKVKMKETILKSKN
jgi:hypothetical protein